MLKTVISVVRTALSGDLGKQLQSYPGLVSKVQDLERQVAEYRSAFEGTSSDRDLLLENIRKLLEHYGEHNPDGSMLRRDLREFVPGFNESSNRRIELRHDIEKKFKDLVRLERLGRECSSRTDTSASPSQPEQNS